MTIKDVLSEVQRTGELIELYDRSHAPTTFSVGTVEKVSEVCTVLRKVTKQGEDGGSLSILFDQVAAVCRDTRYLSPIARLVNVRSDRDVTESLPESDAHSLQSDLASACSTGEVVTVTLAWESDEPGNDVTGIVMSVEEESAQLRMLTDDGADDGTATVLLECVVQIRLREEEHRRIALLRSVAEDNHGHLGV